MDLTHYRTLGRSGLSVSPLCLGAMTFGTKGWGADADGSARIFDDYVGAGGNFVDTADIYSGGESETLVGRFVAERGLADRIVVATKSGFGTGDHPHSGGNGAKHVKHAVEGSLKRLGLERIDLYWQHVWDMTTPAEEVLETMGDLKRAGKIAYWAMSNVPAWYAAKVATLAAQGHGPAPIALQFEYSLVERGIENEHVRMAQEFGMGIVPWSPLGGGLLSGKYRRDDPAHRSGGRAPDLPDGRPAERSGSGRLAGSNPFGDTKFTDRNFDIVDALVAVAEEIGEAPAAVALAWLIGRPGVASVLAGASRSEQIQANRRSLSLVLPDEHRRRLDEASAPMPTYPATLWSPMVKRYVFGGQDVAAWR